MKDKDRIAPHFWYTENASPATTPSGRSGSVTMVEFTLNGRAYAAAAA